MKVTLSATAVLAVAGVVVLGYVGWRATRAASELAGGLGQGVADVVNAVNPVNRENIFASGVNNIGGAIANDPDWNLGGWLYDLTHTDPTVDFYKTPAVSDGTSYEHTELPPYFAP